MNAGVEAFELIACGFRPEGSLAHLAVLVALRLARLVVLAVAHR